MDRTVVRVRGSKSPRLSDLGVILLGSEVTRSSRSGDGQPVCVNRTEETKCHLESIGFMDLSVRYKDNIDPWAGPPETLW